MNFYITEKLDLEQFEQISKINTKVKYYKREKLAYLLHLLIDLPTHKEDLHYTNGYISLSTIILQKCIRNYKDYFDLLIAFKVIESDNHYIIGEKNKWYRYTEHYAKGVKVFRPNDFTFIRNIERYFDKQQKFKHPKYTNLKKWFNEKLEINYEEGLAFLCEDYLLKFNHSELLEIKKNGDKKNINTQFNSGYQCLLKYQHKDFCNFTVDDSGLRFHSVLTTTRSVLRNALTYDGKEITSIDIANSQPYFSILLLDKSFWAKKSQNLKFKDIISNILINNKYNTISIMLSNIAETLDKPDVQRYINLVVNGEFYNYFEEEYFKRTNSKHKNYREIKSEMFLTLYSDNRYINKKGTEGKDLFADLFPSVYKVFSIIKKKDNSLLPILLQRIESDVILDSVCRCLTIQYPKMPIFTCHDSIATTSENAQLLKKIMNEALIDYVGSPVKLKEEVWTIKNLRNELDLLKSRILVGKEVA